jgi:hypothetical protein
MRQLPQNLADSPTILGIDVAPPPFRLSCEHLPSGAKARRAHDSRREGGATQLHNIFTLST